jgi:hypothetical protein
VLREVNACALNTCAMKDKEDVTAARASYDKATDVVQAATTTSTGEPL